MEKEADEVLDHVQSHGFSIFKVGGYVRDKWLQMPISDIDMATSATPEQVMQLFPKVIPTGIKHGTVTVCWKSYLFEVTTFRQETGYSDHRHPDQIQFVSRIEDDLSRRDFTMNAMAMDRAGEWIDPFGGREDLDHKLLRAVGMPFQRFSEDALRILRGIRFCARFSLDIEEKTWIAMTESGKWLLSISKERIRDEICKIIEGKRPITAIDRLCSPGLFPFPDWVQVFQSALSHPSRSLIEDTLSVSGRWAFLFALSAMEPEQVYQQLINWRFPKRFAQDMKLILRFIHTPIANEQQAKKNLLTYDWRILKVGLEIQNLLHGRDPIWEESTWEKWNYQLPIRHPRELAVSSQELIQRLHKEAGPWLNDLRNDLLEKVALLGLPNQREVLLEEARKVLSNEGTDTEDL